MMKTLIFYLMSAILPLASWATAPQQADPAFNTVVARPSYTSKHPKVLFDHAHMNAYTSSGVYQPFVDLISHDGFQVTPGSVVFSKKSLKNWDVLIIANARGPNAQSPAFTDEECDAVRDFVQSGKALLLLVDHSPFNTPSAGLAKLFGVEISPGHAVDKVNYNKESQDQTEIVFSREGKNLVDHSITQGRDATERVNRFVTFSGTSLKGPENSFMFLRFGEGAFEVVPPEPDPKPLAPDAAPRDYKQIPAIGGGQGVALEFGKGRVVVIAEAAALTAQIGPGGYRYGMNSGNVENRQLALNVMHWLSRLLN